jgi:hypothetical protein
MNTGGLVGKLLDVVVDTELDEAESDFPEAAFNLLALAISLLGPEKRERAISAVEDGELRRAVGKFPDAFPLPRASNGHAH